MGLRAGHSAYSHKNAGQRPERTLKMNKLQVTGMSCGHCRKKVFDAVSAISGVSNVDVDLTTGAVTWDGDLSLEKAIREAVEKLGFKVK